MLNLIPSNGTRVIIDAGSTTMEKRGTVIGSGAQQRIEQGTHRLGKFTTVILVQLDNGFFAEDRSTFVSVLAVHPDNLTVEV